MLRIDTLTKTYGEGAGAVQALGDITLDIPDGEFFSIVGPSGAGKTTLLRCLAGLLPATSGTVEFDGRTVTSVPDDFAVVLQDYSRSLFPWFSVASNVGLPLRARGVGKKERAERVE
ncbi:MAG: ATP-binding cassette domain-containing protein, partial [Actinomycetaceae bacterium]